MAINIPASDLQIIRAADGLELDLEPLQGLWSEQQYLHLTDQTNHLVEFTDGVIEVLPMPTKQHQAISQFLLLGLLAFVRPVVERYSTRRCALPFGPASSVSRT